MSTMMTSFFHAKVEICRMNSHFSSRVFHSLPHLNFFGQQQLFQYVSGVRRLHTQNLKQRCFFVFCFPAHTPRNYSINTLVRKMYIGENITYGKSAIRPQFVAKAFVHWPVDDELLDGVQHQKLTRSDALTMHIRATRWDGDIVSCKI